jgi:hypothetical protein
MGDATARGQATRLCHAAPLRTAADRERCIIPLAKELQVVSSTTRTAHYASFTVRGTGFIYTQWKARPAAAAPRPWGRALARRGRRQLRRRR